MSSTAPTAHRLVLDDAIGEELHRLRGQHRRRLLIDPTSRLGEVVQLRIEEPRVGVEREVETHPEGVALRRVQIGVDVPPVNPGVLHPRHPPREVVIGGRAQRRDPDVRVAVRHDCRHEIDCAPFP